MPPAPITKSSEWALQTMMVSCFLDAEVFFEGIGEEYFRALRRFLFLNNWI